MKENNDILFRTIQPSDIPNVITALNDSFSQYSVKLEFGKGKLQEMIYLYDIELDCSIISVEDGRITGIVLAGRRGEIAHIGPMGVIREKQGLGLGKRLMDFSLDHLRNMGAKKVLLEVIADNHRARRLYESCGFVKTRILRCYRARKEEVGNSLGATFEPGAPAGRLWSIKKVDPSVVFDYGIVNPGQKPWQRDYDSVSKQKEKLQCIIAYDEEYEGEELKGNCGGIIVYLLFNDHGIIEIGTYPRNFDTYLSVNFNGDENDKNEQSNEIKTIVLKSVYMNLVLEAVKDLPHIAFKNVTPEEDFCRFARDLGFENYLNQFEMEIDI